VLSLQNQAFLTKSGFALLQFAWSSSSLVGACFTWSRCLSAFVVRASFLKSGTIKELAAAVAGLQRMVGIAKDGDGKDGKQHAEQKLKGPVSADIWRTLCLLQVRGVRPNPCAQLSRSGGNYFEESGNPDVEQADCVASRASKTARPSAQLVRCDTLGVSVLGAICF
jgi:hypothetical protein